MARRIKLLTGLSTVALTGALALSGCGGEGEGAEAGEGEEPTAVASETGEGESEGSEGASEGEGGESEGEGATASNDPATDDSAYLWQLGLIRGHLIAFYDLYQAGHHDMAEMHVKHPESEIYAGLLPAFEARGKTGFATELAAVANAAVTRDNVPAAYDNIRGALDAASPENASVKNLLQAVSKIVRTAGDEYDIAVEDDGAISNVHEYQDAYGFVTAAREMVTAEASDDINAAEAIALVHEQLDLLDSQFDGIIADQTSGEPSAFYGAAARIEIAALGLG